MNELSIPEKFLIIAHHPDKGRFRISPIYLKYGLAGALLLEMSVEGNIHIENGKLTPGNEEKLISGNEGKPGHPILEDYSRKIRGADRSRHIRYWIRRFAMRSDHMKWQLLNGLEKKRILRIEHHKILGLIPLRSSHLMNKKLQYDLIREARNGIMQRGEAGEAQLALLGLVHACKMHRIIGRERSEIKVIRRKLKELLKESPIAEGVDQTIRQVQAAIIAAVATSGAVASAGSAR